MERLMPKLVHSAAESLPIGSYLYSQHGLDGPGMYRVTRIVPEKNEVYGMLTEAEPLSKPWWHYNRDEGLPSTLPMGEFREIPKKKRTAKRKKELRESNRSY